MLPLAKWGFLVPCFPCISTFVDRINRANLRFQLWFVLNMNTKVKFDGPVSTYINGDVEFIISTSVIVYFSSASYKLVAWTEIFTKHIPRKLCGILALTIYLFIYSEMPCFAERRVRGGGYSFEKKQVFVMTAHLVTRQLIPLLYSMNKKRISIKVRSSPVFLNLKVMIRPSRQIMRWFKVSVFIDASLMVYLK